MSAGMNPAPREPQPSRSLDRLAPRFRAAVVASLAECQEAGLDAMVFEAYRSAELQAIYYARGRTVKPPFHTVTNARSNLHSWHGFGLAVDVIHAEHFWTPSADFWPAIAEIFKRNGCDWGGDWTRADLPHFQWGTLRVSPSDRARQLLQDGGMAAVWGAVGAMADAPPAPRPRLLMVGTQGEDVRRLQRVVGIHADGVFGRQTELAVRSAQRRLGLLEDGVVGSDTRRALRL